MGIKTKNILDKINRLRTLLFQESKETAPLNVESFTVSTTKPSSKDQQDLSFVSLSMDSLNSDTYQVNLYNPYTDSTQCLFINYHQHSLGRDGIIEALLDTLYAKQYYIMQHSEEWNAKMSHERQRLESMLGTLPEEIFPTYAWLLLYKYDNAYELESYNSRISNLRRKNAACKLKDLPDQSLSLN